MYIFLFLNPKCLYILSLSSSHQLVCFSYKHFSWVQVTFLKTFHTTFLPAFTLQKAFVWMISVISYWSADVLMHVTPRIPSFAFHLLALWWWSIYDNFSISQICQYMWPVPIWEWKYCLEVGSKTKSRRKYGNMFLCISTHDEVHYGFGLTCSVS